MSSNAFNYLFNIFGNATEVIPRITEDVEEMNGKVKQSVGVWDSFEGKLVAFNNITQYVERFAQTVSNTLKPGADLNTSMADLSAISGETGEGLKTIERYARESAKTFGGSAAQGVEAYKLLLSQLSPELTKTPEALKAMGDNIMVLSKTMGGDATAAANVLTTAMNQYGVSLKDPAQAAEEMGRMMNVMAAAGREGSAELPTIKEALSQCGMAAKAAGVSFVETNAAIQVLDKAGKKGSEGGVALRNVMNTLAKGRFLPKDVTEELQRAGVDINTLGDTSKGLTERIRALSPIMNDNALIAKFFGRENMNAALALMQGVDEVDRYSDAIDGTTTAYDQAAIIMDTYAEKKARIQAKFDDLKISIFNCSGDFGIWVEIVAQSLIPISQLIPLLSGLGKMMSWIKGLNWGGMWNGITRGLQIARTNLLYMNRDLRTGSMLSLGFGRNVLRAAIGLVKFATVGIFNAVKGIGAYILSLVTGGTASATFSGIASGAFTTFKVTAVNACRAVGVAIMNIPVIGWIIAIITALGALFAYFWKTSAKFRATMKGTGAFFVQIFKSIWDVAKGVFSGIWKLIKSAFTFDGQGMKDAINGMCNTFKDAGSAAGRAYKDAYDAEIARSEADKEKENDPAAELQGLLTDTTDTTDPTGGLIKGIGGTADKADKIKNITVSIQQLVGKFEIHTTNLKEDTSRVKEMVAEALLGAVNDLNYAGG